MVTEDVSAKLGLEANATEHLLPGCFYRVAPLIRICEIQFIRGISTPAAVVVPQRFPRVS